MVGRHWLAGDAGGGPSRPADHERREQRGARGLVRRAAQVGAIPTRGARAGVGRQGDGPMRLPECRIIVQRYQGALYKALRQKFRGAGPVIVDGRHVERRRCGAYTGVERRRGERRRPLTPDQRAMWTELRHLVLYRSGESLPAWSPRIAEAWAHVVARGEARIGS